MIWASLWFALFLLKRSILIVFIEKTLCLLYGFSVSKIMNADWLGEYEIKYNRAGL